MDCSLPGSSIHGIFQTRVLEWGAIAFSAFKQQEEANYKCPMFFLLHTKLKWAFSAEMFFLSYVNETVYLYLYRTIAQRRWWHPTPVLLSGKSHGRRSLVGCSPWGPEESDMTEQLHFHFSLWCIGEGNGNPLQCSCLENPRDRGAWWDPMYGVTQSQTQLTRLSSSIPSYAIFLVAVRNGTVSLVSLSDFSCCAISMQRISVYSFCILCFTKFTD